MIITKDFLNGKNACEAGITWFDTQKNHEIVAILQQLLLEDKFDWANWLISKTMNKNECVKYAIYAASLVLDIFEKKYPNDNRPRKAIEAANQFLTTKSTADAAAAQAAAYDAAQAAAAADAYAAQAAAYDAAYDAADAARAADADAAQAAYAAAAYAAAAYAAAAASIKNNIITYGINLFTEKE